MQEILLPNAHDLSADVDSACTRCGACEKQCAFLNENGTPGEIARRIGKTPIEAWPDPFHCSLCGLCGAVCPEGLRPEEMFLAMRQSRVEAGTVDLQPYAPVLNYEKLGDSTLLSYIKLPAGGDTVLFPGCALPATRSQTVRRLFLTLQESIPDVGVALGCCMKPSHDLGRTAFFAERFGALHDKLIAAGVKRVITACPNCQKVLSQYGGEIAAITAYEILAESGHAPVRASQGEVVIHDPCPQRYDAGVQDAVRDLVKRCSMDISPMRQKRERTRCCGEGGMVKFVRPEFADAWTSQRSAVAKGRHMVTSCAGCANFLGASTTVDHVLDVLFDSKSSISLKPPLTYVSRFLLKQWFRMTLA
ncbi:(Fe-S)-binding protein [Pseudodesulfovibrio sp.]|nr:(Fe-S)-binding protein [Pseudodesulfovibrio sp.]